jgi:SAM-dependent methyltransferase
MVAFSCIAGYDLHDHPAQDVFDIPRAAAQCSNGSSRRTLSSFLSCIGVGGDANIRVRLNEKNVRALEFLDRPGYIISKIPCVGPAPVAPLADSPHQKCNLKELHGDWKCKRADFKKSESLSEYAVQVLDQLHEICRQKPLRGLFLGLGGGVMQTYLQQECPNAPDLTTIDNSSDVVKAAQDFFGFRADEHNKVVIGDAYEGLQRLSKKGAQFDFVVIDTLPNKASKRAFNDAFEVLKPGGKMLFNWEARRASELRPQLEDLPPFEGGLQRSNAGLNFLLLGHKAVQEVVPSHAGLVTA